jgi:microcystin-dependent protein
MSMATPFVGEVKMFGFNWPPKDWALCNGASVPVNQNPTLYSLLATTYGGNGTVSFNLPDLCGRVPVHEGNGYVAGQFSGFESIALNLNELPAHSHVVKATSDDGAKIPSYEAAYFATSLDYRQNPPVQTNCYAPASNLASLAGDTVSAVGGNQAHSNMQPSLVMSFCIALTGVYPSRN